MSLTLSTIISRVNRKIQQASSKLGGQVEMIAIINEANRDIQSRVDLICAKRTGTPRLIMNEIYEYAIDSDCAYDKMIEAMFEDENNSLNKSQFQRSPAKFFFSMKNPYNFNAYGTGYATSVNDNSLPNQLGNAFESIAVDFLNGSPYLMVRMIEGKSTATLSNLDTYDGNGTWVIGGDTATVVTDDQKYREGSGSVRFDSAGVTTAVSIANSTLTAVDLTDYEDKAVMTLDLELPSTIPTSVTLRWGSDASNYWEKTVTVAQNGLPLIQGWNTLGFDWQTATQTGSPTITDIDYIQLTVTNSAATAATYRADNIVCRLGRQCTLKYYSKFLVLSDAGVRKADFTLTDDTTMMQEREVNMLVWAAARIANQQLRQWNEADRLEQELQRMVDEYKQFQPSQEEVAFTSYYIM